MVARAYRHLDEVRSDLSVFPKGHPPRHERDELAGKVWDALLEMSKGSDWDWDKPLDILDKIEEEFSSRPDLDDMVRPEKLP